MAKKEATKERKRKTVSIAETTEGEAPITGSLRISKQFSIDVPSVAVFDEYVIELGTLISEEPDSIQDTSGNSHLLDPKRPPYTDAEGLHVFFAPALSGSASYGFNFLFTYNEAVVVRMAVPKTDEELAAEAKAREPAEGY